ncbi:MAG: bifunctional DNA-formamidopyrimidine glycosylase/DNA-(apurinic or apyrimidinic site) lyase [Phycisphaerales bacterium]|nr:bifunctional DNA-formamidopyrimidine glycosylase/DNA-(apurinic or apyrimidinic site) lyase [Phycisphaerales bacterium]
MPELPEVETIAVELRQALIGVVIKDVVIRRTDFIRTKPRNLAARLRGKKIKTIEREGKRLQVKLAGDLECVIHLGMSGRVTLENPGSPLLPHTHVRIRFARFRKELRFRDPRRFGGLWFFDGRNGSARPLSRLGPDALSIRVPVLRAACKRRRQMKALLLDQQVISGLGNIYCDEALFGAKIHPLCLASDLTEPQVRNLACNIRKTLRNAIDSGGSTLRDFVNTDGSEGVFQKIHRVYGREGQPCPRCQTPIERIQCAGRSTHVCPCCQPWG